MSGSALKLFGLVALMGALSTTTGCDQVRGRRKIQEANKLYRDGQYKEAIVAFQEAEQYVPNFWVLWLNKGYTCRQLIIPGAKTPETILGAKCALASFKKLQELKPEDPRGELMYVQTLFDSDQFELLAKLYEERYQKNPRDIDVITGLIQVYTKWNKLDEALEWYTKKAEIQANDPEAQYSVGVFIWGQLSTHGGGPEMSSFDPRPDPNNPRAPKKTPPLAHQGDIVSQQRIDLADKGLEYLNKAVALRPKYHEAMTYINLLYRQKSFAYFDQPDEWQKCVDKAREWMYKALETMGKPVSKEAQAAEAAKMAAGEKAGGDDEAAADDKADKKKKKGPKKGRSKKKGRH